MGFYEADIPNFFGSPEWAWQERKANMATPATQRQPSYIPLPSPGQGFSYPDWIMDAEAQRLNNSQALDRRGANWDAAINKSVSSIGPLPRNLLDASQAVRRRGLEGWRERDLAGFESQQQLSDDMAYRQQQAALEKQIQQDAMAAAKIPAQSNTYQTPIRESDWGNPNFAGYSPQVQAIRDRLWGPGSAPWMEETTVAPGTREQAAFNPPESEFGGIQPGNPTQPSRNIARSAEDPLQALRELLSSITRDPSRGPVTDEEVLNLLRRIPRSLQIAPGQPSWQGPIGSDFGIPKHLPIAPGRPRWQSALVPERVSER